MRSCDWLTPMLFASSFPWKLRHTVKPLRGRQRLIERWLSTMRYSNGAVPRFRGDRVMRLPEHLEAAVSLPPNPLELEAVLKSHGRLFSEEVGIQLSDLSSDQLLKWLVVSLLFGARIRESAAVRTYRELEKRGLLTPEALRAADFWEMIDVMASGGYSRYDGITTRKLQGAATKLLEDYGGDLKRLHALAADGLDLVVRLKEFWGVGDTTAGILLRELRGLWPKANPPIG